MGQGFRVEGLGVQALHCLDLQKLHGLGLVFCPKP